MIEINLMPTKKGGAGELQNLLSKMNLKGVLFAIFFFFVPEMVYLSIVNDEIQGYEQERLQLVEKFKKISAQVRELKKIEEQIDALKKLEVTLEAKLVVVREIIDKRQNPFGMLHYVAKNCPSELWLTEVALKNNKLIIKGFAETWKSIGVFLENLKSSIFFDKNIQYEQPRTKLEQYKDWERKEYFEITAGIVRYE